VLKAAPKGSAPGPSGWTYEHIIAATQITNSAVCVIQQFVSAIVSGTLPHIPALLDSTLIGLHKPGGRGIRPIAIPEVWYRLAGLCAKKACPGIGAALAPMQLGVDVRGGSEIVGHSITAGIAADPDGVTVQTDYGNAFNTLWRTPLLAAVAKHAPPLLPLATWAYAQPSRLLVHGAPAGTAPIQSQCGVRQGDAMASLLFALTTQDVLVGLRETHPDAPAVAYADDTHLQGSAAAVTAAFPDLQERSAAIGLQLRLDKCGAYSPNAQLAADTAAALGIQHLPDGMVCCGTPVGSDAFVTAHANSTADATCSSIADMLDTPLSAQEGFILLRSSLQQRITHLTRTAPWPLVGDAVERVEDKAAEAAFRILQIPEQPVVRAGQLTLPLRSGGMGIRSTSATEARAAFLSAAALAETAMRGGALRFRPFAGPRAAELTASWQALHAAGADTELWPAEALEVNHKTVDEHMPSAQRKIAQLVAKRRSGHLFAAFDPVDPAGRRNIARLHSCASSAASAWLDALPTSHTLRLTDSDFRASARHRLGLPWMPANAPGVRCLCNLELQPHDADHAMTCKTLSGAVTLRHDIVVDIWRRIAHRAGIPSSVEPPMRALPGAHAARAGARPQSRGDILLVLPQPAGMTVADVSVTHPAAETYLAAAATRGGAAALRDQQKRALYETRDPHGYTFIPLSHESHGTIGTPAWELLKTLTDAAASGGVDPKRFRANALRELSVGLCKGNATLYRRSQRVLARASGRAFMPGMDFPTEDVI
jgi:hypothetical protein